MPHEHHRALLAYLPSPHAIGCDSSGCCSTILTKQHRSLHLLARIAASTTNGEDVAHHRDLTSPLVSATNCSDKNWYADNEMSTTHWNRIYPSLAGCVSHHLSGDALIGSVFKPTRIFGLYIKGKHLLTYAANWFSFFKAICGAH